MDFEKILNQIPSGVIVTDASFEIIFINDYSKKLFNDKTVAFERKKLSDIAFFTLSNQPFDFNQCIKALAKKNTNYFNKSLLLKNINGIDLLVFLSAKFVRSKESDIYYFTLSDFSSEADCMVSASSLQGGNWGQKTIIGVNDKIKELHRLISLAADTNVSVLITGESGTGKELIADAIHFQSERKNKAFVKVNCSALSETLLESELFGHVKGSFTGAYKDKVGKFELADGGTIFLDEIGEISPSLQVKLLRVIQTKTIERVGDTKSVKVDMRIIAATNRNLREMIAQELFREDFFYRLNVFPINTPPLRERKNDIPLLCKHYIKRFNNTFNKHIKDISPNGYRLLMDYCWPGNVRELENVIEHAFVVVQGNVIDIFDFPQELRVLAYREGYCKKTGKNISPTISEAAAVTEKTKSGRLNIDKESLISILEKNDWNQTKTAEKLGISRIALWKKIKKFEISV